jgi:hypothetical protein
MVKIIVDTKEDPDDEFNKLMVAIVAHVFDAADSTVEELGIKKALGNIKVALGLDRYEKLYSSTAQMRDTIQAFMEKYPDVFRPNHGSEHGQDRQD